MKIRILLFGILALIGGYSVAQTKVSLVLVNDSVIVINNDTIKKNAQNIFEITQFSSEYLIVESCKRNKGLNGNVKVFKDDRLIWDFGLNTNYLNSGDIFTIPIDSTIRLQWAMEEFNIHFPAKPVKCDLMLVNDTTIQLNEKKVEYKEGTFYIKDSLTIQIQSMGLSNYYDRKQTKPVLIAEITKDSLHIIKAGTGRKMLNSAFAIQPNKNMVIVWGEHQWRINGQTMPTIDNSNWIEEYPYVWFSLLCILILSILLFIYKPKDTEKDIMQKVALICNYEGKNFGSIKDLINQIKSDGESESVKQIASQFDLVDNDLDSISSENLIESIKKRFTIDIIKSIANDYKLCEAASIEGVLKGVITHTVKQISEKLEVDHGTEPSVEALVLELQKRINFKKRSLEDIIKQPTREEKKILEGYVSKSLQDTKTEIENNIIDNITQKIDIDEETEKWIVVSELIAAIEKSKSFGDISKMLFLYLYKKSDAYVTISSEKCDAERALIEKDSALAAEVKEKYSSLFGEELIADNSQKALLAFTDQIKKTIKERDETISSLESQIVKKEGEINEIEQKTSEIEKMLAKKDEKLVEMYKEYADFIIVTFEQIETSVKHAYTKDETSFCVIEKIHNRIINNDSWGLSKLILALKEIAKMNLDNNETKKEVKKLFLRCLQYSSWIDILAQLYLYIQEPAVAQKLTQSGLDCRAINKAFVLTEWMMRQVDIKLQYPKLFSDTFNEDIYDEENLSEIQDLIGNVSDLVGNHSGLLIDLLRIGYSVDGISHKPLVSRFN